MSALPRWIHLVDINPVPWKAPGFARTGGKPRVFKDGTLTVYQAAVKEALEGVEKVTGKLSVTFYFWRRLDHHNFVDKKAGSANAADATNLQKALEDALQGVLFTNDRDNVHVQSWVMEQGPEVQSRIIIRIEEPEMPLLPDEDGDYPVPPCNERVERLESDDFDVEALF